MVLAEFGKGIRSELQAFKIISNLFLLVGDLSQVNSEKSICLVF